MLQVAAKNQAIVASCGQISICCALPDTSIPPIKSPSKMTVHEWMSAKTDGPPTELDHKLFNHLLDKFDKSNPLIEVKTGGTVSKTILIPAKGTHTIFYG